jgi:serine phosphatase RsbU (regulator of sigma subunit)/transcriptional regulator with GAF, ATPase, and Fis domain
MTRSESAFVPPRSSRLWIGIAIAVIGPLVVTPLVRTGSLSLIPGVPYVLVIMAAALVGRLIAGGIAIAMSTVLLDRFVISPSTGSGARTEQDLWAVVVFVVVALVIAELLARLERTIRREEGERDRLRFIAEAGDALSGPLTVEDTLHELGNVLVPALADWFAVDLLEDGRIRTLLVVHPDPEKVALAHDLQRRFPTDPDAPTGSPQVIRTGRSELTETIPDEMLQALVEDPELLETMRGLGLRCAMVVPLTARGRTFGALTLIGAESHERYGPSDLQLAEQIADRAALAIDTARAFADETEARAAAVELAHRNEVLKDVTAAFGRAATVPEVLTAMLELGVRSAGPVAATVGILDEHGRVEVAGLSGYEVDDAPYWHTFALTDPLPMSDAIRNRRPVVLSTTAERDRRYPALQGRGEQRDHALVCLPLLLGDVAIGAFSASYAPDTDFGEDDLSFLRAIGEQCAQAIDRARARERATKVRVRFDALATASRTLALTLDYDETARAAVRLAVQHLGAHATLFVHERGGLEPVAHADASAPETDESLGWTDAREADLARAAADATEEASPVSVHDVGIAFPLTIAGITAGALAIGAPSIDPDDEEDVGFAREVTRRVSRAMENARLYRERDRAAVTLQASLLPPELPDVPGIEVASLFLPAIAGYAVGGDFYDVFELDDGRWVALVGDVCGKGLEAAALTGLARHTLRAVANVDRPSEALEQLNRALLRERIDGRFCTVALAIFDPSDDDGARATISVGGHPLPHHVRRTGETSGVGRHGTLLGVAEKVDLHDDVVRLGSGECLVLFTDGIVGKRESTEGSIALRSALRNGAPSSASELRDRIERFIREEVGGDQLDDVAVLVLMAR